MKKNQKSVTTSIRLPIETMARIQYLISKDEIYTMTEFFRTYADDYFSLYCDQHNLDVSDETTFALGYLEKSKRPRSMDQRLNNKKIIRQMQIKKAKEEYERATGMQEHEWSDLLAMGGMGLEQFLEEMDMIPKRDE